MANYRVPEFSTYVWQQPVLDKDLTAPPAANKGDRYIVATGATGAWAGQDGNITVYNGSTWDFVTKKEGMLIYIKDEDKFYNYVTSWQEIGTALNLFNAITKTLKISNNNTQIFYIDVTNGDDDNPGTEAEPFQTIQKGIDSLYRINVGNDDSNYIVYIVPGTYTENLFLFNFTNISVFLTSTTGDADDVILVGGVNIQNSNNVFISAITIEVNNDESSAISSDFSCNVIVNECKFRKTAGKIDTSALTGSNIYFWHCYDSTGDKVDYGIQWGTMIYALDEVIYGTSTLTFGTTFIDRLNSVVIIPTEYNDLVTHKYRRFSFFMS